MSHMQYKKYVNAVLWHHLYSRAAVVPLHTQRFAAIRRLQQLELQQYGLVQVSANKCVVVVDWHADNWGVHYRVSGQPGGERESSVIVRLPNQTEGRASCPGRRQQRVGNQIGALTDLNYCLPAATKNWTVCYFVMKHSRYQENKDRRT